MSDTQGEFRHEPIACPSCGYMVNAATGVDQRYFAQPTDGDLAVCLACAAVNVFMEGGTALRTLTVYEKDEIMNDPIVNRAVCAVLDARDRDPEWPKGTR